MFTREFYKELGKLLYAVANVDGKVNQKEAQKLLNILSHKQLRSNKNEINFDANEVYSLELEFHLQLHQNTNTKEALQSFLNFYHNNKQRFNRQKKELVIYTVNQIAASHHGTNRAEHKLLKVIMKELALDPIISSSKHEELV